MASALELAGPRVLTIFTPRGGAGFASGDDMLRSYSAREDWAKGAPPGARENGMATKKRTTTRSTSAKAKPAARTNTRRKAKREPAHAESAKGIVYTSVLRELMARRLAKG